MGELIRRVRQWLQLRSSSPWVRRVNFVAAADQVPDEIHAGHIVIVGSPSKSKWVVFACPCGRGHIIWLNLQASQRPRWRLRGHDRTLTLRPSIWVDEPLGCHFLITRGRVLWVPLRHPSASEPTDDVCLAYTAILKSRGLVPPGR